LLVVVCNTPSPRDYLVDGWGGSLGALSSALGWEGGPQGVAREGALRSLPKTVVGVGCRCRVMAATWVPPDPLGGVVGSQHRLPKGQRLGHAPGTSPFSWLFDVHLGSPPECLDGHAMKHPGLHAPNETKTRRQHGARNPLGTEPWWLGCLIICRGGAGGASRPQG
jgi:hypothetical protein